MFESMFALVIGKGVLYGAKRWLGIESDGDFWEDIFDIF